jgi:hypothetical protein
MNWRLEFFPVLPVSLLIAAAAISAVIALLLLWRGRRGSILRVLALAMFLAALANPNLKEEEQEPLSNIAAVVVDESASQKIGQRAERTEALKAELGKTLGAIPGLETRWLSSSSSDGGASRDETTLFSDLSRGLVDVPPERLAGVIMITDGQVHDAPKDVQRLGFDAPVHALLTGSPGERDNRIEIISAPRFGLVGSTQTAEIQAVASPASAGKVAKFIVRRENQAPETLTAPFGQPVKLSFPFTHAGPAVMEVELEGEPGELTLANNRAVLQAEGVREHLRVLLVSGEPHAGERTWRNLLRSDALVDLVHFTILRPPEKQDGTPINQLSLIAFPTRELFSEKLSEFDLIIFDRYQRRGVLPLIYLDNVARYVEQGGAVLVAAGSDYSSQSIGLYGTPLADVLPAKPTGRVIEEPFRPQITPAGLKHPVTSGLPGAAKPGETPSWGRWFRVVESQPENGEVVMSGAEDSPLLVLSRQGKGRVAVLLSDHAWLWARGYEGGGPYGDLLRRLAHWLMKEPDLEEEALHASATAKTLTIERRSMQADPGQATVTTPSGKSETVTLDPAGPGLWRKTLPAAETGLHRITMGELSAVALIGAANTREMTKVTTTDEMLKPVLEATGGGAFWMGGGAPGSSKADLPRVVMLQSTHSLHGEGWLGLKDRKAHLVRGVNYTPLFSGFAALAAALALIGAAWFRESR